MQIVNLPTGQLSVAGTLISYLKEAISKMPSDPGEPNDIGNYLFANISDPVLGLDTAVMAQSPNYAFNLDSYIQTINPKLSEALNLMATGLCRQISSISNLPVAINSLELDGTTTGATYYINSNVSTVSCGPYTENGITYGVYATLEISYSSATQGGTFSSQSTIYQTVLIPFLDTPSIKSYISGLTSGTTNVGAYLAPSYPAQSSANIPPYTPQINMNGTTPSAIQLANILTSGLNHPALWIALAVGTAIANTYTGFIFATQYIQVGYTTNSNGSQTPSGSIQYGATGYSIPISVYTGSAQTFTTPQDSMSVPLMIIDIAGNLDSGSAYSETEWLFGSAQDGSPPGVNTFSNSASVNPPTLRASISASQLSSPIVPPHSLGVNLAVPVNAPPSFALTYVNNIASIVSQLDITTIDGPTNLLLTPVVQPCSKVVINSVSRGKLTFENVDAVINFNGISAVLSYPNGFILSTADKVEEAQCITVMDEYEEGGNFNIAPIPLSLVTATKVLPTANALQLFGSSPISGKYTGKTTQFNTNEVQEVGNVNNNTVNLLNSTYYPANYFYEIATPSGLQSVSVEQPSTSSDIGLIAIFLLLGVAVVGGVYYKYRK